MNMYSDHKNKKRQRNALTSQRAGSHFGKKKKMQCKCTTAQLVGTVFHPRFNNTVEKCRLMTIDFSSLDVSGVPEAYGLLYVIFQSQFGQGSGACQLPLTWNPALSLSVEAVMTRLLLVGYSAQLIWWTDSLTGSVRTAVDEMFCRKNVDSCYTAISFVKSPAQM